MALKDDVADIKKSIAEIHVALLGDLDNHDECPGVLSKMDACREDRKVIWRALKGIGIGIIIIAAYLITGEIVLP